MSTDHQKDSIDRQKSQVGPYIEAKGYLPVRQYEDRGIAGDVFDRRPGFQQLLRDAKAGLFSVIVTDEWSRLSRQEPVDFIAKVVKPLKDAGVTLDCVAEGPQRWDDLAQLILMTVKASKSQDESKTKSYRTLTGMGQAAALGRLLGSHAPYGYLTEYETVTEPGRPPRVRPIRLIVDQRRAHVVRWIFERYAEGGWSIDDLARALNSRGVEAPPPGRKGGRPGRDRRRGEPTRRWTRSTVRAILKNPRYTGALVWNRRSRGKYHRLHDNHAVVKTGGLDCPNPCSEWLVIAGVHDPLVSQELFDRAQARLRANRGGKPSVGAYLFSGLLTCSHCGRTLGGIKRAGQRVYRCHMYDGAGEIVCGYNAVSERWMLGQILRVIRQDVLAPGRLAELRQEVRRQEEAERAPAAVDPLRSRLAELKAMIDQGNGQLLLLSADRIGAAEAKLREWEAERDQLEAELGRRQGAGPVADLDEVIAACEAMLWRLEEAIASKDELQLREVIREAVARVELAWERRPYGKKTRYVVLGGVIHLRPQTGEKYRALPGKPCSITRSGPFLPAVT
jgi:DNA invertase Pin-like site-specific DNA recombinase